MLLGLKLFSGLTVWFWLELEGGAGSVGMALSVAGALLLFAGALVVAAELDDFSALLAGVLIPAT